MITGAKKEISLDAAKQFAKIGYYVYIGSRNKRNGIKAVEELKTLGFTAIETLEIDVTNPHSIVKAKKELQSKITQLDDLVNNAGIRGAMPQNTSEFPLDTIRTVYETNFFGVIQVTQHF